MKTVLGLSLTSASVGWVLLDLDDPDAPALDHDAFDVLSEAATDGDIDRHLAAVRGAQAIATSSGHEVRSIRVTWTDDAEAKGSLLLKALPDLGFDDVQAVLLSQATRAWAKALTAPLGFEQCAVCVLEPAAMTVLAAHTGFGTVRMSVTHVREHADGVARWLTEVFDRNGWQPEDLYLVGARGDLELTSGSLEEALPMPVVSSDDAQLSLARGAALSVPMHPAADVDSAADDAFLPATPVGITTRRRPRFGPHARAGAALVAGVIALFAVGPELAGQNRTRPAEDRPPANSSASVTSATSVIDAAPAGAQPPPAPPRPGVAESLPLAVAPPPAPVPPATIAPVEAAAEPLPNEEQVVATPVVAPVQAAAEPDAVPVEVPEPLVASEPDAPAEAAPISPALAPPAPALAPPLEPQPAPPGAAPPPPPPPDPVQMVLSPFFGALP